MQVDECWQLYCLNTVAWSPVHCYAALHYHYCSNLFYTHTHTHTRLTALFPGLPGWAGTRKVKPIWILLQQETVSGSGISWAICKQPAPHSRQITTPAPHHSVFTGRMPFLPPNQQRQSTEGTTCSTRRQNEKHTFSLIQLSMPVSFLTILLTYTRNTHTHMWTFTYYFSSRTSTQIQYRVARPPIFYGSSHISALVSRLPARPRLGTRDTGT